MHVGERLRTECKQARTRARDNKASGGREGSDSRALDVSAGVRALRSSHAEAVSSATIVRPP